MVPSCTSICGLIFCFENSIYCVYFVSGVVISKTVLCDSSNHTEIFRVTRAASEDWRDIGMELGFSDKELTSIVHEPGRTRQRDYYSAMLGRWLDWSPPNHDPPSIQQLSAALREVGKEKLANDLDTKCGVSTSK